MKIKTLGFAALSLLFLGAGKSMAQTTIWGSSASPNPVGFTSNGAGAGASLTWTIGWFNNGFTPTSANYDQWAANYVIEQASTEQSNFLGFSAGGTVTSEGAAGQTAYIFVYNSLGAIGTAGGEAMLFTEGYVFPGVPDSGTFDIAGSVVGASIIWGSIDRDMDALGGVMTGGGVISNPLADATNFQWEVQTATWGAVPEPSVSLLGALGSLALFKRRRKA